MHYKTRNINKATSIKAINILILALALHIFSVHSRLLYYLNPESEDKEPFSFIVNQTFQKADMINLTINLVWLIRFKKGAV